MAQGDGIPLHMAIDMTRACTSFPHAHSLARSPLLDSVSRSYLLSQRDSVPRIFWERLAFGVFLFFFFFHSAGWILRSRRFRPTHLIFISFLFPGSDVQDIYDIQGEC